MSELVEKCEWCKGSVPYNKAVEYFGSGFSRYFFCDQHCHQLWIDSVEDFDNWMYFTAKKWGYRLACSSVLTVAAYFVTHR